MTTNDDQGQTDGLIEIEGEQYYRINRVDRMPPFLMSVVSDGDRWMFVSSSGALTAGRRDATQAMFPYVTDDRLHAAGGAIGPVTAVRVRSDGGHERLWEPFATTSSMGGERSIAKTIVSDSVRFEERCPELGLVMSYQWSSAEHFGFVRTATLLNTGSDRVTVDLIDGLVDVLPAGLSPGLYHRLSNLSHAYKRSEVVDQATGLALYTLESPVSDQAEPEEVLRATTVWSTGLVGELDMSVDALAAFRRGEAPTPRPLVTGVPGAYLRRSRLDLGPGAAATWFVVGDVGRDHLDVSRLRRRILESADLPGELATATRETGERLAAIIAPADSEQRTADAIACAHHCSNVIYNVMRGGVPLDGYRIDTGDFATFLRSRNRRVLSRNEHWLVELPAVVLRSDLVERVAAVGDVHLRRLVDEYLPFSFSRRHGDPSRPWNEFSIRITGPDGEPLRYFEGNWRDVFQNWEALCASFPEYLPGVVSMFVNASTADGHNPYRITRDGIDWEEPDPDDPWANIGYWGDHQIVYLLRLLEATEDYFPGLIAEQLDVRSCTYADVPYRIAPYADLVLDPKSTIAYDDAAAARSARRVDDFGADGKLLVDGDGELVVVTLLEKLLVTTLAKLANLVPGGGIWMNTQRPEWNDANNALVGYGLSMVTLFHLRRFVDQLAVLSSSLDDDIAVSAEVATWMMATVDVLGDASNSAVDDDVERRAVVDGLGSAASQYRTTIYSNGFSGETSPVSKIEIARLCEVAIGQLDATIARSRRPDGLVHAYNLIRLSRDSAVVEHLPEMLEGQVAALTPGLLEPREQADLLDALFASNLYRADQDTFMLMPPVRPPTFLEKNVVEASDVRSVPLLDALVASGDTTVVGVDASGIHRFAPDITRADALAKRLDELATDDAWADLVDDGRTAALAIYESVFHHRSHLGRSGSMYAYEGIGSIYWHMVTKLLLAVQEAASDAADRNVDPTDVERLRAHYERVRNGLGVDKTPQEFGAVPIDPYSHTPEHAGAQQPGMTGAVKEEILTRRRELGARISGGQIAFDDLLLRAEELLDGPAEWIIGRDDGDDTPRRIDLPAGSLGFTLCEVPVVVSATKGDPYLDVDFADGRTTRTSGDRLPADVSAAVFARSGEIRTIRAVITTR